MPTQSLRKIGAAPKLAAQDQHAVALAVKRSEPVGPRIPLLDCEVQKAEGYRGGRKVWIDVVSIDQRLVEVDTADAYFAMQLAAAQDGVELAIYSGFRSDADQEYFYNCFKTCSCNACAPADKPGHSKHQSGRALDMAQWEGVYEWLTKNAKRFRFFPTVAREPWHWEYLPRRRDRLRKPWPRACAEPAT